VVTLTNGGSITLDISSIATTGAFSYAAGKTPCGSTLAAGKSCQIKVSFAPTQVGTNTGTLAIYDNGSNSPQTVALSGTGDAPVVLTPATATFAKTAVGATSAAKAFKLDNRQSIVLDNIVISTTGDFSVSSTTCGKQLTSDATCNIDVVFTPTAAGTTTGTLQVSDAASNSPQTSTLTGTGK
jgi:hypothetical protein